MIRKADWRDMSSVVEIYDHILTEQEAEKISVGWVRGVYPTEHTVEDAIKMQELFVDEENGRILAAARINQMQMPEYSAASWRYQAPSNEVMVLHTLVVEPKTAGKGYGKRFIKFYEAYALDHGCRYLRMDTNELNQAARSLYRKLGYQEIGIVPCVFNGIPNVRLVCLEKYLGE